MIRLKGISFILTYQCNLDCAHCFFSHDNRKGCVLGPATVQDCLDDIHDSFHLEWLHVTGGEPFLFQNNLIEMIKIGKDHGISNIGTVTNAFWATSRDIAIKTLNKFKDAGLTGLCVSADSFHQADIPLERVKNVLHAMKYLNLNGHSYIVSCFIGSSEIDSLQNKDTEMIINEIKDIDVPIARVPIRPIGKGINYAETQDGDIEGPCEELCMCLGETGPLGPKMVYVDSRKLVQICYGITIGNLSKNTFGEILSNHDSSKNIIIDTIGRKGPISLLEIAEGFGYKRKRYTNRCHLCYELRKFLLPYYPDTLSPLECYP